jgi:hypothetical protein
MDFGNILSRAWQITWRWKVLWILGFLASLGGGFSGLSGSNYRTEGLDWGPSGARVPNEVWGVMAAVGCLGLLLGIVLWVVSTIARGGLITGVQQVEDEGSTTFGAAWRAGIGRFWTLLGISILTGLPSLIVIVAGLVILGLLVLGTIAAIDAAAEVGGFLGGSAALLCGGGICCGGILLAVVLSVIRLYAERAAMLEGLDWINAFKRGWQILKENLGPTVVLWLIFLVIGMIVGAIIVGPIVALLAPFSVRIGGGDPIAWLLFPICLGGLLWVILLALVGSVVETFTSATWTLAYRQFTGSAALPPVEAAGPE